MPLEFRDWIVRQDLRKEPDKFFVFGDNVRRTGLGGQAKEMRGEPNAIGVATKWFPGRESHDYFSDTKLCQDHVENDLFKIDTLLKAGKTIVVPRDGIGTGLSELPQRAPRLDAYIREFFRSRS